MSLAPDIPQQYHYYTITGASGTDTSCVVEVFPEEAVCGYRCNCEKCQDVQAQSVLVMCSTWERIDRIHPASVRFEKSLIPHRRVLKRPTLRPPRCVGRRLGAHPGTRPGFGRSAELSGPPVLFGNGTN